MKTILVKSPFTLNLGGGTQVPFAAGKHEVEDKIAAHWYVQAHSEPLDKKAAAAEKTAKEKAEREAAEKAEAERKAAEEEAAKKKAGETGGEKK